MQVNLGINNENKTWDVAPNETLLHALRASGYFGVKHGCDNGECGACAVLVDGAPMNSCVLLAAQLDGKRVTTIEAVGQVAEQGWKHTEGLHPIQQAFVEVGAIQCGYCTPALILAAKALLDQTLTPTEDQVRDALSGVLCRCTGYVKPVQAVLIAAEKLRGGKGTEGITGNEGIFLPSEALQMPRENLPTEFPEFPQFPATSTLTTLPQMIVTPAVPETHTIGKPEIKVDAVKLVQGKPAFTDDIELRGMLYAKVLHSPVAHAYIKRIDASQARALPGVHAVLTYQDIPRVVYSTAGQSDPIPGPLDSFSLDNKVRFVGDRVAFVAAESEEIAERALDLIEVEYAELPAVIDPRDAMKPGAPRIHDESEYVNFFDVADPSRNIAAKIDIELGKVAEGFKQADHVFEDEYVVPKVQQAHIEPHVVVTYWDEDDRLVIRTSTQVPFHARRILAPVLGLPPKRIRVIKPRIGGGFGGKQEVLIEDVAAHLTIATKRPVRFEYTREEEFIAARSRHPMRVRVKTGVMNDGRIIANEMYALSDTGAYGCHALTVTGNTGQKCLNLYNAPNIKFHAHVVYTNTPPSGAYRGYGVPQGFFPLEVHIEKIARALNLDPIEFRLKNAVHAGDELPMSKAWNEGRPPHPETIETCGLAECVARGSQAIEWKGNQGIEGNWRVVPGKPHLRRGQGVACVMQGTAIPYLDMGGASIKINDDGSFNLLVGATDLGTGSDTVLAQLAAEILGCPLDDILVYSSDTDFTPFDKGAYASSTTYISGGAVVKAAEQVAEQIRSVAARMLNESQQSTVNSQQLVLRDKKVIAPDGRSVTLQDVALESLHHKDQHQIMAVASYMSPKSPPPFAAQFAQVLVDTQTGQITVEKLVMAVDSGVIVNPATASGQIEGGMTQALGYAVCEEMLYDRFGSSIVKELGSYKIFAADEMPELQTVFVQTFEPSHPFGLKAVAEIPLDGVAPAVANAVHDAVGVWMREIPMTPERVWKAMKER